MPRARKAKTAVALSTLDADPYASILADAAKAARAALGRYGEPRMTLEQLRRAIADACPGISLSEAVLQQRETGW